MVERGRRVDGRGALGVCILACAGASTACSSPPRELDLHVELPLEQCAADLSNRFEDAVLPELIDLPESVVGRAVARGDALLDGRETVLVGTYRGIERLARGLPPVLVAATERAVEQLIVGDFNGDARGDVLYLGLELPCNLGIAIGQADGTLTPAWQGKGCWRNVRVADLDGDGRDDIVYPTSTVMIRTYDDALGLSAPREVDSLGTTPWGIETADMDGDGSTDLIIGGSPLRVLRNTGSLTFELLSDSLGPEPAWPLGAADFDNDGDVDVLTPRRIYWNDGNGLLSGGEAELPFQNLGRTIVTDIDRDGDADIVTHRDAGIDIAINDGEGDFSIVRHLPAPNSYGGVAVLDFDGDLLPDFVTLRGTKLGIYPARGPGVFRNSEWTPDNPHLTALSPTFADLTGNGIVDVVIGGREFSDEEEAVAVYREPDLSGVGLDEAGALTAEPLVTSIGRLRPLAFDSDGDGDQDIAVLDHDEDALLVFSNDGMGSFVQASTTPNESTVPLPLAHTVDLAADLDGDDRPDIVMVGPRTIGVFWQEATGSFTGTRYESISGPGGPVYPIHLRSEWRMDIVQVAGLVAVYENVGGRSFELGQTLDLMAYASASGDFDNDGDLDVAALSDGRLTVLHFGSAGITQISHTGELPQNGARLAAGDLDGDGDEDLAYIEPAKREISLLLNDGRGRFCRAATTVHALGDDIQISDLDDDGHADILSIDYLSLTFIPATP